jgi:hypothetical protein
MLGSLLLETGDGRERFARVVRAGELEAWFAAATGVPQRKNVDYVHSVGRHIVEVVLRLAQQ